MKQIHTKNPALNNTNLDRRGLLQSLLGAGVGGAALMPFLANSAQAATNNQALDGSQNPEVLASILASKDYANVMDFGALGDGVTNDILAFKKALQSGKPVFVPRGRFLVATSSRHRLNLGTGSLLFGSGAGSEILLADDEGIALPIKIEAQGASIRNLKLTGVQRLKGGITIAKSQDIVIDGVHFENINQCVWLREAERITVQNCVFNSTGYGIIQQRGYASNHVQVLHNYAINMLSDFVEANCTKSAPSENWSIIGNHYLGSAHFPTETTEARFVGITSVKNVIISQNHVQKVSGDSAVHLEDSLGRTIIANNTFENCTGSHAYLYILNTEEETLIQGNIFSHTDTSLPHEWVLDLGSGSYHGKTIFSGNMIFGNTSYNLSGLNISYQSKIQVLNNSFQGLNTGIRLNHAKDFQISHNSFDDCQRGIGTAENSKNGGFVRNGMITHNRFNTLIWDLLFMPNTNGTGETKALLIASNLFAKGARGYDTQDVMVTNNITPSGIELNLGLKRYKGSLRYNSSLNVEVGKAGTF